MIGEPGLFDPVWETSGDVLDEEELVGINTMFDEMAAADERTRMQSFCREADGRTVTVIAWRRPDCYLFTLYQPTGARHATGARTP